MGKRGKLSFHVKLQLAELIAVPYVTGVFFAKVKRESGHRLQTPRCHVENHSVRWQHVCEYDVTLKLLPDNVVDSLVERLCVRMETDGGRGHDRFGLALIDLAEFAGRQDVERRYLLHPEKGSKAGQTNCVIRVIVSVTPHDTDVEFKPKPSPDSEVEEEDNPIPQLDGINTREGPVPRRPHLSLPDGSSGRWSWHEARAHAGTVIDEILSSTAPDTMIPSTGSGSASASATPTLRSTRSGQTDSSSENTLPRPSSVAGNALP